MTVALSEQDHQLIKDQIQSNVSSLIYNSNNSIRSKSSDQFFLTQFDSIINE